MKTIFFDESSNIIKNKRKLENFLSIKIILNNKEITIEGNAEDEYIAEKVFDAINMGFSVPIALLIREEDFILEILDIKKFTHRKDLEVIRARIIGAGGKTLKTLNTLTDCHFEIKDNEVGIIGSPENIENAHKAVASIIQGSKQANVYAFLEKHQVQPVVDLGLKEKRKGRAISRK